MSADSLFLTLLVSTVAAFCLLGAWWLAKVAINAIATFLLWLDRLIDPPHSHDSDREMGDAVFFDEDTDRPCLSNDGWTRLAPRTEPEDEAMAQARTVAPMQTPHPADLAIAP